MRLYRLWLAWKKYGSLAAIAYVAIRMEGVYLLAAIVHVAIRMEGVYFLAAIVHVAIPYMRT
jgi:hypothetical protein